MQAWLLSQGKCVGCGKLLAHINGKVICDCGRIYMYDEGVKKFRRATLDEIK